MLTDYRLQMTDDDNEAFSYYRLTSEPKVQVSKNMRCIIIHVLVKVKIIVTIFTGHWSR